MTAIIGYIYKDSANLIVDSALTFYNPSKSEDNTTVFGEAFFNDENKRVSDELQKINNLGRGVIGAFAGSVFEGERVVEDLSNVLLVNIHQRVSQVIVEYFNSNSYSQSNYILAFHEDAVPKIFFYRDHDVNGFLPSDATCVMDGSVRDSPFDSEALARTISNTRIHASSTMEALVTIIGIAQLMFLNNPKLEQGVGGTFNGAYVDGSGINWAKDTVYWIYSAKNFNRFDTFYVTKYNRDDLTIVANSRKVLERTAYASTLNGKNLNITNWTSKWDEETRNLHLRAVGDYFVALCTDRRIITVFDQTCIGNDIRLTVKPDGIMFSATAQIRDVMLRPKEVDDPYNPLTYLYVKRPQLYPYMRIKDSI